MKKVTTVLLLLFCFLSYSQDSEIEKIKKDLESIKVYLKNEERIIDFGNLNFNLNNVALYKKNAEERYKQINIEKIELSIIDGCIVKIKVYADSSRIYYNHNASIAITKARFEKEDLLQTNDKSEFIIFKDLLKDYQFDPFTPEDDENVIIDKKNQSYGLRKDVSLNGLLDTRIYSDLLGFFGDEKNSILQTEVKTKLITNRNNIINRQLIPVNYLNININYNKIDSKSRYVNSLDFRNSDLLQKSIFNVEIGLNVFKSNISKHNSYTTIYGETGTTFSWNKLVKNSDTITVNNTIFFIETGIKTRFYKQTGLNFGVRFIRLMSPITKEFNQDLNNLYFNFMKFNLDLFYILNDKKKDRIFFKINYFKSTNTDVTDNQFPQIQVGYSKLFTSLF